MAAPAQNVRQARGFLREKLKAGSNDISPRLFANAAHEQNMSFSEIASVLARLYAGGQNEQFYRERAVEQNLMGGDS